MPDSRKFAINCETLGPVELETQDWKFERDGNTVQVLYNAMCKCGKQHSGFATPPFIELVVFREVAEELGRNLLAASAGKKQFVRLLWYPQAKGLAEFVHVEAVDKSALGPA